jgi:hypothetical protein
MASEPGPFSRGRWSHSQFLPPPCTIISLAIRHATQIGARRSDFSVRAKGLYDGENRAAAVLGGLMQAVAGAATGARADPAWANSNSVTQ